jgi:C1A family cysteine protease
VKTTKLLSSNLCLALGALVLAGCGAARPNVMAPVANKGSLKMASKAAKAAFPWRMGWDNPAAKPIVNDLRGGAAAAPGRMLGFSLKQAAEPKKVDLRDRMSPVADQGNFGSCTGFAMVKGVAEFMELKGIREHGGDPAKDFVPLSPAYLWYNERAFMGTEKIDTGATMFLGMNLLVMDGVSPEADMPYCAEELQTNELYRNFWLQNPPSRDAQVKAKKYRGGSLRQITKLSEIKSSLDEGYPAVFGFVVFSNIRQATRGGYLPMPSLQEDEVLGGHATVAVGYDDEKQVLILKNSWSENWGDKGYFYMPYEFFNTQFGLVADGWTLRETN